MFWNVLFFFGDRIPASKHNLLELCINNNREMRSIQQYMKMFYFLCICLFFNLKVVMALWMSLVKIELCTVI